MTFNVDQLSVLWMAVQTAEDFETKQACQQALQYYALAMTPEILAHIAKLEAALPPQGDGWQDIASAPRDGTLCLFFAPGRNKAKYIERAKRQMTVVDAFSPQWVNGKYQLPENPYTHWRPLPAPPAAELERTKGET